MTPDHIKGNRIISLTRYRYQSVQSRLKPDRSLINSFLGCAKNHTRGGSAGRTEEASRHRIVTHYYIRESKAQSGSG
jgi:hypothetical protein